MLVPLSRLTGLYLRSLLPFLCLVIYLQTIRYSMGRVCLLAGDNLVTLERQRIEQRGSQPSGFQSMSSVWFCPLFLWGRISFCLMQMTFKIIILKVSNTSTALILSFPPACTAMSFFQKVKKLSSQLCCLGTLTDLTLTHFSAVKNAWVFFLMNAYSRPFGVWRERMI